MQKLIECVPNFSEGRDLGVIRQITAQSENHRLLRQVDAGQQQLAHRANHDPLTDLANRALFEQRIQESLARMAGGTLSVAVIDMDDFKAINDRLGHAVGDALLVVVGQRLRECVRQDDVVARLSGDEPKAYVHGITRPDRRGEGIGARLCRGMIDRAEAIRQAAGGALRILCSGVATNQQQASLMADFGS